MLLFPLHFLIPFDAPQPSPPPQPDNPTPTPQPAPSHPPTHTPQPPLPPSSPQKVMSQGLPLVSSSTFHLKLPLLSLWYVAVIDRRACWTSSLVLRSPRYGSLCPHIHKWISVGHPQRNSQSSALHRFVLDAAQSYRCKIFVLWNGDCIEKWCSSIQIRIYIYIYPCFKNVTSFIQTCHTLVKFLLLYPLSVFSCICYFGVCKRPGDVCFQYSLLSFPFSSIWTNHEPLETNQPLC